MSRIARTTPRIARVTSLALAALVLALSSTAVWAEDAPADPGADLRLAGRASAPGEARLAAARRLAAGGVIPDVDRALYAAASLLPADPATAGLLVRAALEAGPAGPEARAAALAAAKAEATKDLPVGARQDLAAVRVLLGDRQGVGEVLVPWPPSAFALSVLQRDAPEADVRADARLSADVWSAHAELADLLDRATDDDVRVAWPAMDALRARRAAAVPLLLAVASGPSPTPPGLVARRVRAIVVLGTCGDDRATAVLAAALSDREDGWVRAAAAAALGDLGDPSAVVPLARTLFYLGDVHRPRDSWDYPGKGNTDVPPEAWNDVDYYVVDVAIADALLRLGVRDAGEWILRERLDPRTGRWRVRVLQDAVDAIRRSFPDAPKGYEPDAGYPRRLEAWEALVGWWRTGRRLARPLDEKDARFAAAAHELAASIGGKRVSVMNLQIAKRAAAILGPAATPSLLAVAADSKSRVQRAEIAVVLGTVRDRRAIAPLLAMTADPVPAVRANAAEALAAYADPVDGALLSGPADVGADAIVARWIALLDDPEAGPRASALKAMASLPPRADVRDAVAAHAAATHPENAFGDWTLAEQVVSLVQTGEGLDGVLGVLRDPDLFRRRFVWELLRSALRLEPWAFDPAADPGSPRTKRLDPGVVRAALARRRGS